MIQRSFLAIYQKACSSQEKTFPCRNFAKRVYGKLVKLLKFYLKTVYEKTIVEGMNINLINNPSKYFVEMRFYNTYT